MVLSSVLQLLVVVSTDWDAVDGTLYRYQRLPISSKWELMGAPVDVSLGKMGMAWGKGIHPASGQQRTNKREGDWRSPAGLFSLGTAFGDASHQKYAKSVPFLLITEDLECVDDPDSSYYNRFVMRSSIENPDWRSSEKMQDVGPLYAIGLVVEHNTYPIEPGMGSAVFMHIWIDKGEGTHGCTAMRESDLNTLVSWLDVKKHPCLVQLPMEEYRLKKEEWDLPELNTDLQKTE
jgi:L,D-peptidoglycan transpeptidase YkuD (ErfK/YbiS/YcfS/YnhG family)